MMDREHHPANQTDGTPAANVAARFVDVHCHCLPNLDDGPESVGDSLALCRALVADHVDTVVATPHQLGRFEMRTSAAEVREAVRRLNRALAEEGLELTVLPGAEVRLDERIDRLLVEGGVLTLADLGRHLLLELPRGVFIDIEPLLTQLLSRGVAPIIAHPERDRELVQHSEALQRWLECGASLQVTAASLTGDFGPQVQEAAWMLVARGWVSTVAGDAHHHRLSPPRLTAAFGAIRARLGQDRACLLCIENPARVIHGERLAPVETWTQQGVS